MRRIVLAYYQSLVPAIVSADRTFHHDAIAWLGARYDAEVVTLTLDFGQGRELEALRDRALATGAARAHVLDVAAEFASQYLLPALKAGVLAAPSGTTGLGRLIIAQKLVDVAGIEATTFVAHGCQPDDPRIAAAVASLAERFTVVPLPPSVGRSTERGGTPGPHPARRFEPAFIDLTFAGGMPTAINSVPMTMVDLIASLDMLVGSPRAAHVGLVDSPSAAVMHRAHASLVAAMSPPAERDALSAEYAAFIDRGTWFSPERHTLDRKIDDLEDAVNGTVRLRLLNDACDIVEIKPLDSDRLLKVR